MIQAIEDNTNWTSANTCVTLEDGISKVYLHGNKIAAIGEDWMQLFDGGRQSKTTKSRLNALLSAFGMDGEYVCLLYTSPSPRDGLLSRMPSSA